MNVTFGYLRGVFQRVSLDLRLGTPWRESQVGTVERVAAAAWADPAHPASEGARAAVWAEAMAATVGQLLGDAEVVFFPNRDTATEAVLSSLQPLQVHLAATHRRAVAHLAALHASEVCTHAVDANGRLLDTDAHGAVVLIQHANDETGVSDAFTGAGLRVLDATNTLGRTRLPADWDVCIADARAWGSPAECAFVATRRRGLLSRVPAFRWRQAPPLPVIAVAVAELEREWSLLPLRAAEEEAAMTAMCEAVRALVPTADMAPSDAPHLRSISVAGIESLPLARALDQRGFAVGAGSACTPDGSASHVLEAMGRSTEGNLRLALPIGTDLAALARFPAALADAVAMLRG